MVKTTHAQKASEEASSSSSPGHGDQRSSSDQYKGIRKRKWGKWVSEIRLPNSRERIWLGSYDTPQKAARAFDAALFCLRGPHAKFNFPHNPPNIAGAHSLTPPQIRAVAARFANEIQEEEEEEEQPPAAVPTEDGLHERAVLTDHHHDQSQLTLMEHYTSTTTTSSSDGAIQVHVDSHDRTTIDWSFLNLSDSSVSVSDFDLGLDNLGGELFPPLTPPTVPMDDDSGDENGGEAFSQQSFLWNF